MRRAPKPSATHAITAAFTRVERPGDFVAAARLSKDWLQRAGARALVLGARLSRQIEGTLDIVAGAAR